MIKVTGMAGDQVFRPSTWADILVHEQDEGLHIVMCNKHGVKCVKVCVKSPHYARIIQFAIEHDLLIEEV